MHRPAHDALCRARMAGDVGPTQLDAPVSSQHDARLAAAQFEFFRGLDHLPVPIDRDDQPFRLFLRIPLLLRRLGAVFEEQVEDTLDRYGRRRMDRRIGRFDAHVVLCGYGRVGIQIARLLDDDVEIVVIDSDDRAIASAADAVFGPDPVGIALGAVD